MGTPAEPGYDELVRWYLRVITSCEAEKDRLRAQVMVLQLQLLAAELTGSSGEARERLAGLIDAIEDEIGELGRLGEAAREGLRDLRRDHGPVRHARADSPHGGAEKDYYQEGAG